MTALPEPDIDKLLLSVLAHIGHTLKCPRRTAPVRGECICGLESVVGRVVETLEEHGVSAREILVAVKMATDYP